MLRLFVRLVAAVAGVACGWVLVFTDPVLWWRVIGAGAITAGACTVGMCLSDLVLLSQLQRIVDQAQGGEAVDG